jgi:hypothetical protein
LLPALAPGIARGFMSANGLEPLIGERAALGPPRSSVSLFMRRHIWVITGFALVVLSIILLLWARTRPGYDPYGWLVWGYQTLHLTLNLGGAPSWKPLPYLFTVPYALTGHFELRLWQITAVVVALAGCIFAGRIAYRVTGTGSAEFEGSTPIGGSAPVVAAVFAGAALLGLDGYMHYILSAQSDPMIVTFCLAGIDMYLCGRYRWAFAFGVLGSLGRPEVWPFLALYSIWAWFKVPTMRMMLCGGIALIAIMWFGIPWITNGRPDIAGQLALGSPRRLDHNQVTGTIGRFTGLHDLPVWIAALGAAALAVLRRNRLVLTLAGGVVLWVMVEIAFAFHGFPALPRYMFEAGGVVAVLAGIGVGWALIDAPQLRRGLAWWSGIPVVVILIASLVPGALARVRTEHVDLRHERGRTNQIALLQTTIETLGGHRHIDDCGEPITIVEYASALAWLTHLDVGSVGYIPNRAMRQKHPIVLLLPVPGGGWMVRPWHTQPRQRAECSGLHAAYLLTKQNPAGVLIHGAG